jgi:hypothetical protein
MNRAVNVTAQANFACEVKRSGRSHYITGRFG